VRRALLVFAVVLTATNAQAAGPEYVDDPFGDSDFEGTPLIMDIAHPPEGRGEVGLLFSTSMIDKYSKHLGGMLDFNYSLVDSLGVGVSLGFLHGALTTIVTDQVGIIGNKVDKCQRDGEEASCDATPNVPDFKQITGSLDLYAVWFPFYGKVNLVSEADVNTEFYVLLGAGVNGTREAVIDSQTPSSDGLPANVTNQAPMDGGLFGDLKVHGTFGIGLKVYFTPWFAIRSEFRGVFFRDEFPFSGGAPEGYTAAYWLGHIGANFIVF
jgi:outer membrane beta-barrel protein